MTVGLLDTSVIIELGWHLPRLPESLRISTLSLAELAVGVRTAPKKEREGREARLALMQAEFDPIPFGPAEAQSYGRVVEAVRRRGRRERGRAFDLLIAATAAANDLPLYTLNGADFLGLHPLVDIVDLGQT